MGTEIWEDVEGYKGRYQVSSEGRIKSLARKSKRDYRGDVSVPEKILKQQKREGYLRVTLTKYSKSKTLSVHRLVAGSFIPNPKNRKYINHKDGDKTNNNVSNLEWCTCSENQKHAYDNGLCDRRGENSSTSLTNKDVLEIRAAKNLGCFSDREIAKAYGVSRKCINHIVNRNTWRHI